ncbi:endonuclease/exonuclease/phosphatase family protein [Belliella sp. DSM 111904]|uniref:Endonuclease/exonuclease/phosphatase family protein n=1 Tax=Belliella filtrata TaxID=2923435 RepID=A0ABS9UZ76_9BACT|nr:endonuclease/exonuclease/phosphatase family protein [Belliella filtrata]MCH7409462.1 endonuclease/exonuclease/phosphatase family protein [Belliella filtrata]
MKTTTLSILICLLLFNVPVYAQLTVSTFNIRFDNPGDGVHQWSNRKDQVLNFIQVEQVDVLGMQEALYNQIQFLADNLEDYSYQGVGRDDGDKAGEFSPILYNHKKFELLDGGTFWLSTDTSKPNKAWDAALPRICTWVHLKEKGTEETYLILNTHFDHVGKVARVESVGVILEKMKEFDNTDKVIIMGDFNLEPDNEPIKRVVDAGFSDSFHEAKIKIGPVGTFNAFKIDTNYDRRIDYVFYQNMDIQLYKNYSLRIDDTFLSDHFPVVVQFK